MSKNPWCHYTRQSGEVELPPIRIPPSNIHTHTQAYIKSLTHTIIHNLYIRIVYLYILTQTHRNLTHTHVYTQLHSYNKHRVTDTLIKKYRFLRAFYIFNSSYNFKEIILSPYPFFQIFKLVGFSGLIFCGIFSLHLYCIFLGGFFLFSPDKHNKHLIGQKFLWFYHNIAYNQAFFLSTTFKLNFQNSFN